MKFRKSLSVMLAAAMLTAAVPSAVMAESSVAENAEVMSDIELLPEADAESGAESVAEAEETEPEVIADGDIKLSRQIFPCYVYTEEACYQLPLYFVDDVMDMPFIEITDLCEMLVTVYQGFNGDTGYGLHLEKDGSVVQVTRENGYTMTIDFDEGTVLFEDYDAFIHRSVDTYLLENVTTMATDESGNEVFLKRNAKGSYDRYGKEVELNLSDYDIPLYMTDDGELYLVPVQTMGDFLLAPSCLIDTAFNNHALFLVNNVAIRTDEGLTKLGATYAQGPSGEVSEELAGYSYNELCLVMDKLYGLKELHGITSFDDLFTEIGYKDKLLDVNPSVKDGALSDFITYYLDDLHSGRQLSSFRTTEDLFSVEPGVSVREMIADDNRFRKARTEAGREVPSYEEVGNTAYVTFDTFNFDKPVSDYYEGNYEPNMDPADEHIDTLGLIFYAHKQITREDSPIENVVLDLSLNGGGAIDAAAVVAAWFLGDAEISIQSSFTGARSTSVYQADINLDGQFDEKDTLADKNLYCLTSPVSFSCGNLIPAIFKYSHSVTLLGQTSGGGSCSVLGLTTAYGSFFQISSMYNLSHVKNGSYYEIDLGVEPDFCIDKPANFYNRDALTDYINKIF